MSKTNEKIRTGIRHLTTTEHPVLSGIVQRVDTDTNTATVVLTLDDEDNPTENILLNVILNNANGLLMIPSANANCIVGNVDGNAVKQLLWAEKYDKVLLTISNTIITVDDSEVDIKQDQAELKISGNLFSIKNNNKSLATILGNILQHIESITVPTPSGTSGVPTNISSFQQDASDLNELLN